MSTDSGDVRTEPEHPTEYICTGIHIDISSKFKKSTFKYILQYTLFPY